MHDTWQKFEWLRLKKTNSSFLLLTKQNPFKVQTLLFSLLLPTHFAPTLSSPQSTPSPPPFSSLFSLKNEFVWLLKQKKQCSVFEIFINITPSNPFHLSFNFNLISSGKPFSIFCVFFPHFLQFCIQIHKPLNPFYSFPLKFIPLHHSLFSHFLQSFLST